MVAEAIVIILATALGALNWAGALLSAVTGWKGDVATFWAVVFISLMIEAATVIAFPFWQRRRRAMETMRRVEDHARQRVEATAAAKEQRRQAAIDLERAGRQSREALAMFQKANEALIAAKAKVQADFERGHPRPALPTDVKHEESFCQCAGVSALLSQEWVFGADPSKKAAGPALEAAKSCSRGLVSREPRPMPETALAKCPGCGKRRRVPIEKEVRAQVCDCGFRIEYCNGAVYIPPKTSLRTAGQLATDHSSVLRMARDANPEETLTCPACSAKVKARNLVAHFDKNHGNSSSRGSSETSEKSGAAKKKGVHDFDATGICRNCGSSRGAAEHFRWTCRG